MPKKVLLKRVLYSIWTVTLLIFLFVASQAGAADEKRWKELETKNTIICYRASEDLNVFDRKVKYSPISSASGLKWLFSGSESKSPEEKLKDKVDALYARVQEILGMRKRMDKVRINIYPDKDRLREAYYYLFKTECRFRAWYVFEINTIFVNVTDLHEGMLAHEIAHSIIDNYLSVRPPSASAEILARYVDSHLHK